MNLVCMKDYMYMVIDVVSNLDQGFNRISFLLYWGRIISSYPSITFQDFMLYLIYDIYGLVFISHNQNTIIHPQDVFGISSQKTRYIIVTWINLTDSLV